jgi:hypothetical protein
VDGRDRGEIRQGILIELVFRLIKRGFGNPATIPFSVVGFQALGQRFCVPYFHMVYHLQKQSFYKSNHYFNISRLGLSIKKTSQLPPLERWFVSRKKSILLCHKTSATGGVPKEVRPIRRELFRPLFTGIFR